MTKSAKAIIALAMLTLSACSVTHPLHGVEDNGTQFLGTATGYFDGNGDINVVMDDGRHCSGTYTWEGTPSAATANGTFKCDGGITGTFSSEGTAESSTGFGHTSDGHKFKFYTGQPPIVNQESW